MRIGLLHNIHWTEYNTKDESYMATETALNKHTDVQTILIIQFNKTAMNILIPLLISSGIFIVELYSKCYILNSPPSIVEFLHMINTCFAPTHVATAAVFLYEFYSSSQWQFFDSDNNVVMMEVKTKVRGAITVILTIIIGFFYILCNMKVTGWSQAIFLVLQFFYMLYLYLYGMGSKTLEYREKSLIRDVLMGENIVAEIK